MTLEELPGDRGAAGRMEAVGDALEEVLSKALSQRSITIGVYEAAKLLNVRQRGAVPAGGRRGGRPRRGPADPLHAAPGLLLRERHQHPPRQQPGAPGAAAARRRAARRPPLRPGHAPPCLPVEGPGAESADVLLPGESLHGSVGPCD
ncbi:growth arrest and DNA damage-inducible protein GADD45 alpha isoform X2 [Struthio camelus]|uniref:growth arrest and DNA damage-inducible protein GADD45 alpha isoform X2 n=1 Tax=Struthio camelus TaxID=8801 RepID=UPI003603DBF2